MNEKDTLADKHKQYQKTQFGGLKPSVYVTEDGTVLNYPPTPADLPGELARENQAR